ncbi:hypothetical protein F6R98_18020 [Candidatus Methylospira mobilis]|uniref:Uncharacterized protein n=1 Tax=Candidatus Methylospira mobilis TaxID=1808979 RepID=A0A5Q0BQ14_9GAMM|nr:hypothetical protein F6R98_18020 [Candidatus Methylospira mobilis]
MWNPILYLFALLQFLSLLRAETDARLYQQSPPVLTPTQIQHMIGRAVEMFLVGASFRNAELEP